MLSTQGRKKRRENIILRCGGESERESVICIKIGYRESYKESYKESKGGKVSCINRVMQLDRDRAREMEKERENKSESV